MKSQALVALAVVLAMVVPTFADDPNKDDHDEMEGRWKLVSVETNGKSLPVERIKDVQVVHHPVKDNVHPFVVKAGNVIVAEGTIKHDEKSRPKGVDMTYSKGVYKGKTIKGIYRIEGDKLTVCWDTDNSERPKDFATKPDSGHTLRVYERAK